MFGWLFGNKIKDVEDKTQKGFDSVKKDIDVVGKWIKHLNGQDKQLFDSLNELKREISTVHDEISGLREAMDIVVENMENKQVLKKKAVSEKQTGVEDVVKGVQTVVQTGSFYNILNGLTANERLVLFTIMNSDMKLSYEDLALLLGKERSTVRGQINSIKQKSEGLIEEISEKNGKKRVFVPEEVRNKLAKYAKVRVKKGRKQEEKEENEQKSEI